MRKNCSSEREKLLKFEAEVNNIRIKLAQLKFLFVVPCPVGCLSLEKLNLRVAVQFDVTIKPFIRNSVFT